jgi:hypothetical protein
MNRTLIVLPKMMFRRAGAAVAARLRGSGWFHDG